VSYKANKKVKFDITTLREEKGYEDARHPNKIPFVKDLSIDVKRRDFTVNALYMDSSLKVIDYVNGEEDLKNRILRMVGNADLRIKEDPLRIIRALRFSIDYKLKIDEELDKAIRKNISLLEKLNIQKIKQDIKKIKSKDTNLINKLFEEYNIKHLIDVIN
jgi:tRNA nucleotidyltransferase (CCA-adding enzyme)